MTEYIGNIPVSSIQNITVTDSENADEIDLVNEQDNFVLENTEDGREIDIEFTLVKNTHPEKLEVEEQREEMKSLVSNDVSNNYFEYNNQKYFLSIDSISVPEQSDLSNVVQGNISSKAFSWPKKYSDESIGVIKRFAANIFSKLIIQGKLQSELYFEGEQATFDFYLADLESFGQSFGENFGAKNINLSVDKSLSSGVLFGLYLGGAGFGDGFGKEFGFSKSELTVYSEGDYGYGSYGDQMYGLVVEEGDYSYGNYNEGNYGE